MVARGVEGDHLLHVHGNLLLDLEGEHLVYIVLHLVEPPGYVELPELSIDAGAGRLGDIYVRLAGSRLEGDDLGTERPGRDRIKVAAFELPVAGDASVYDPAIQRRDHLHPARPVLRGDLPLHGRLVHVGHADEAAGLQRGLATCAVAEPLTTLEQGVTHVVLLPVGEDLDVVYPYGLFPLDPEFEQE